MNAPAQGRVAVIGGGPAGLMAAEVLVEAGLSVDLYDAMPSVGRKFLLAGKGGLNLTHAEPFERFLPRYGARQPQIEPLLREFGPAELRQWAQDLGIATFVGSSGRVFPTDMKAAPLLRAWLQRLRHPRHGGAGVQFHMRHRWTGWCEDGRLCLQTSQGQHCEAADALVLALGGASWSRLGSNGAWVPWLAARGVPLSPLMPANCGFDVGRIAPAQAPTTQPAQVGWSPHFASRFAGQPLKTVAISCPDGQGGVFRRKGEFVATASGVEGSLIYAAAHLLRDAIGREGQTLLQLDLLPDHSAAQVLAGVAHPRGSKSLSSHLKSRLGLEGIKMALLHELLDKPALQDPKLLAAAIKALPLRLVAARPIDEAISSAGGVRFEGLDDRLMLRNLPGVFCAGEMLDWEAPTGGYLLTACLASGRRAAQGVKRYLGVIV
ncbi:MAG: TIGR03862 family flavoprotein [Hylemonella sp.]